LLLENWIVTKTLSFALLTVSTHGVGFVALSGCWLAHVPVSSDVGARCRKFARNKTGSVFAAHDNADARASAAAHWPTVLLHNRSFLARERLD
jgi:hypothetical protein